MKLEEQTSYLASHYVGAAVGTPNRVFKLVEENALSLKHTTLLVIDSSPNVKGQTIFNLPETKTDLVGLLATSCAKAMKKGMKICLL